MGDQRSSGVKLPGLNATHYSQVRSTGNEKRLLRSKVDGIGPDFEILYLSLYRQRYPRPVRFPRGPIAIIATSGLPEMA